jgi:spore germination protein
MGYDLHWQTSPPGPIGPVWWLDDVLAFALGVVPAAKLALAIHLYGYDWVGQHAESQTWDALMGRRREHAADVAWSPADSECTFTYTTGGVPHTVWYGDARSVDARLDLAKRHALGGVALWGLGGEDPQVWEAIRRHSTDGPTR